VTLLGTVLTSYVILQRFIDYRTWIPPITRPDKEECTTKGLVAHWKFDRIHEGARTPDDISRYDGQFQARLNMKYLSKIIYGFPEHTEGKKGKALHLNGKHWISGGNQSCFNVEKFTIALWVWQENEDLVVPTIMAKSAWEGYDGWWLCTTKDRYLDLGIAWGNGFTHVKSGYQLPLKEWHHIAVTVNNTDNEVQFYVDGRPLGDKHTGVHNWLINWSHDLFIGEYDGSGNWPWFGKLDDVRFYANTLLSAEEIFAIYSDKDIELSLKQVPVSISMN
jgi:hypothetical protein